MLATASSILVILRSDGTPIYNFCVVVDDMDKGVAYVIRGDDHLSNTPRQMYILKALGFPVPQYAHLPMVLRPKLVLLPIRQGREMSDIRHHLNYVLQAAEMQ